MSEKINDGGSAFPQPNHIVDHETHGRLEARAWMQDSGMTLRDWFAGMAMQGLISGDLDQRMNPERVGEFAWEQADQMIKQRKEQS
jgi:hypothetical protein